MPKPRTPEVASAWPLSRHSPLASHLPRASRGHFFFVLLVGALLVCCPCALALDPALDVSQYAHTAWRIRDGFTKGEIRAIAQTPDGYLWLGTEFGLYRFDGIRAVPWQPPAGEQLPGTLIFSLMVSRDGTLWIGTLKGLASWKDGKLSGYPEVNGSVSSLIEDREGTVWAGEWAGALPIGRLCAIHNKTVACYGKDWSLGNGVLSLYEDSKGSLWVGTLTGLWRWKPGPPKFYSVPGEPNGIQGLAEDADGALLMSLGGGVRRFVGGKPVMAYPYPGPDRQLQALRLLRGSSGALWIGTIERGLVHVHEGRTDVFSPSDGLSGEHVRALFEDREANIWVATEDGLDRFRNFAIPTWTAHEGLSLKAGEAILAATDGRVWVGTSKGLGTLKQGQVTIYRRRGERDAPTVDQLVQEKIDSRLPQYPFGAFFQDHSGRLWISTQGRLGYFENEQFHSISPFGTRFPVSITEDASGDLWLSAQQDGLFRFHDGGFVQKIPWDALGIKDQGELLVVDRARSGFWIGFLNGGVGYLEGGRLRASYSPSDGLGEGVVNDLRVAPRGTLWAATDGGLSRIKDGHVLTLTSNNGLPCNLAHWSIEDDDHFVWLYLACGLVRIARSELDAWASDPKQKVQLTVFDANDGVRNMANYYGFSPQVSKAPDGRIWFAALDGVSVIDPRHLPFNKLPPPVQVEQITADRKTYDPVSYANGRVPLPARIRDLEIDYTALSLVVPEKVRFRHKLEGRDSDWQDAGNRRQAFYSDLPPRNYRFRVMACNNSGVWNEEGAFLDFSIAPAYYQTMWFRLACVAAFLALLWGLYQLRLRQVAREFNARLEGRVNERTRIARELHDSLLQSVQGLMFRLQAVRNRVLGPPEALEAFDIALDRADEAIMESRDTVSDLRESVLSDKDIPQALTALGEELAAQGGNGTAPCVRVLVEGKQRELEPLLRDEIYRIAREALRNAFRHSKAQKIEAEITYGDSQFLLHVRDDGDGIGPEVLDKGSRAGHWGLPGMRERAKSFGGKLEVWSEQGAGTEIALIIPASIAYGKSSARRRFWFLRKLKRSNIEHDSQSVTADDVGRKCT